MAEEMKKLATLKNEILIANFGIDVNPIAKEKEKIIYSNRLHNKLYRIDKIIEAFCLFKKNQASKDWRLIIAAKGSETDSLKSKVVSSSFSNDIEFIGWVEKEENERWYSKAKIWISIPESDATSISLLEAMACGCIPVVSNLPANCEWIHSNENGIVVQNLESDFISEALKLNYSELVETNRKKINELGTKKANRLKFIGLYEKIIAK
jgi:glycosyltransferase involved in cell wall biosynthesis